jgi:hypothetical protein
MVGKPDIQQEIIVRDRSLAPKEYEEEINYLNRN